MKIDHIAINVADLNGAKNFFETYFQAKANNMYHNTRTGLRTYFLSFDDRCRVELMNRPGIEASSSLNLMRDGYVHLSFNAGSKEAVDGLTHRLAEAGFEVIDGPRTTGDGYYESSICGFENIIIEITE